MGTVNPSQESSTQREMPWLSASQAPAMVPMELIVRCRNRMDAIRLCVQLSNLALDTIWRQLGIDPGHGTRIMQGRANFPDAKSIELMYLCGNFAPMQFEAWKTGFELHKSDRERRIAELEKELTALRVSQGQSSAVNLAVAA
jgi:hypothetical protein